MNVSQRLTGTPFKALALLGCLAATLAASQTVNPCRSRLPDLDSIPASNTGYVYAVWGSGHRWSYYLYGPEVLYAVAAGGADYKRAWLAFDLSAIPDGSYIRSATVNWYQHEQIGEPNTSLHLLTSLSGNAEEMYNIIGAGAEVSPRMSHGNGWARRALDDYGIAAIESALDSNQVAFGIIDHTTFSQGSAYGTEGDTNAPYLDVAYVGPYNTDLCGVGSRLVTYPLTPGGPDTAEALFTNLGKVTANGFKVYALDRGRVCDSTTVGALAPGETAAVRLRVTWPPNGNYWAVYEFVATDASDPWHVNDTTVLRCWAFPAGTYSAEGFEGSDFPPAGWETINNDSVGECWQRQSDETLSHSGNGHTMSSHDQWTTNDDWLISGPVCPTADTCDSAGYFVRSYRWGSGQVLRVWAMRGQSVSDTLAFLGRSQPNSPNWNRAALSLDPFDGDTVFIGFQDSSGVVWNGLCLDDIWFSRTYIPGTCEPQGSLARQPELAFAPNPATGRFVTIRYDIATGTHGRLMLRDVLGRTSKSFDLDPSGSTRLDLHGFAPGIYIATLDATGQAFSRKLIITAR